MSWFKKKILRSNKIEDLEEMGLFFQNVSPKKIYDRIAEEYQTKTGEEYPQSLIEFNARFKEQGREMEKVGKLYTKFNKKVTEIVKKFFNVKWERKLALKLLGECLIKSRENYKAFSYNNEFSIEEIEVGCEKLCKIYEEALEELLKKENSHTQEELKSVKDTNKKATIFYFIFLMAISQGLSYTGLPGYAQVITVIIACIVCLGVLDKLKLLRSEFMFNFKKGDAK